MSSKPDRPALLRLIKSNPGLSGVMLDGLAYEIAHELGHGSFQHRAWLRSAAIAYFQNEPIPEVDRL